MSGITSLIRPLFLKRVEECGRFADNGLDIQTAQLMNMLREASATEYGRKYRFDEIRNYQDYKRYLPLVKYEDLRPYVMRMINGERDVLWHGRVRNFAQSSGTSDGKSKYIPITGESFSRCHYRGAADCVAHYLNLNPKSRIFDGKAFILGGSFANELHPESGAKIGDLSANLIDNINPLANLVRVPSKQIALMKDWNAKLPALVEASMRQNITNISGVPSWFLSVLKEVMRKKGVESIHDVWRNLEVFFHGGISFAPYRSQYEAITDPNKMHFMETYNASEGFFAVQDSFDSHAMLLLLDLGVFYEFIPLSETDKEYPEAVSILDIEAGKTYELVISACNGLWRYRIGDTVRIEQLSPVKITIAGRTKHFINAFGEELMVYNADKAIAEASRQTGSTVLNYTVAPVYATSSTKGRHQWLVEFDRRPADIEKFADILDCELQRANSDYEAKRSGNLFMDRLSITEARRGLFDDWLKNRSGKLGGQLKIPRLYNNREIIESIINLQNQNKSEI